MTKLLLLLLLLILLLLVVKFIILIIFAVYVNVNDVIGDLGNADVFEANVELVLTRLLLKDCKQLVCAMLRLLNSLLPLRHHDLVLNYSIIIV